MPKPGKTETQEEFVARCIPEVIDDDTAKDPKQAAAVCFSMYREREKTAEVNSETKALKFEVSALDIAGRTVEGYASAFGNVDDGDDLIHPGAFTKTLAERGGKVKLLWQHKQDEPIGRIVELREEPRGLYAKFAISDTARGRDALALLRDGAIDSMSIGYHPVQADFTRDGEKVIRNLREVKLFEISLVTFPMNEQAVVTAMKEAAPDDHKAGRMLSRANMDRIGSAVEALRAATENLAQLLSEAEPSIDDDEPMDEDACGKPPEAKAEPVPDTVSLTLQRDIADLEIRFLTI